MLLVKPDQVSKRLGHCQQQLHGVGVREVEYEYCLDVKSLLCIPIGPHTRHPISREYSMLIGWT